MIYCRCSIHKHVVQNESTRGKTKIILLTLEMARQVVSRTTHIEKGELRVTHENAILTNITSSSESEEDVRDDTDLAFSACAPINNPLPPPKTHSADSSASSRTTNFDENVFQKVKVRSGRRSVNELLIFVLFNAFQHTKLVTPMLSLYW